MNSGAPSLSWPVFSSYGDNLNFTAIKKTKAILNARIRNAYPLSWHCLVTIKVHFCVAVKSISSSQTIMLVCGECSGLSGLSALIFQISEVVRFCMLR